MKQKRCPHCDKLLDVKAAAIELDEVHAGYRASTIRSLNEDRIPWMYESELPYYLHNVIGPEWQDHDRPVILRGSRWSIRHRYTPGDRYNEFVKRAARRLKITVLPHEFPKKREDTADEKKFIAIINRARKLAPNARITVHRFFVEGKPIYPDSEMFHDLMNAGKLLANMEGIR